MTDAQLPPGVDPHTPSPARVYDYLLGGTENLDVDRQLADRLLALEPDLFDAAWANRGFLQRATRWMAANGVQQFVDIGAGLPTGNNTHDAARIENPDARVLYVDNDPMAVAHGRSLLQDVPGVAYLEGDFYAADRLLARPEATDVLDVGRPVGILAVALVHFVPDEEDPGALLRSYLDAFPSGSFLAVSHATADHAAPDLVERGKQIYSSASDRVRLRSRAEVAELFGGLELVPPYQGAAAQPTWIGLWGADDPDAADTDGGRLGYAAVARKP